MDFFIGYCIGTTLTAIVCVGLESKIVKDLCDAYCKEKEQQ